MKARQFLTLLALTSAATAVCAQPLKDRLEDCAGVVDQKQRLACYDGLAREFLPGPGAPVDATSPGQFGLEHKTPDPVEEIAARIVKVGKNALGKMVLTLDNGQVWAQKDNRRLIVHEGDEVRIERGALSAFYLSAGDNRRIQVARAK